MAMSGSALVSLLYFFLAAGHGVFLASAQSGWAPCAELYHYTSIHQSCYVESFGEPCSELYCYDNTSFVDITVQDCEDPVTVFVHVAYLYDYDGEFFFREFQYKYNQSEAVENTGVYSYDDDGLYSVIMDRNESHLGFELYVERDDLDAPKWLIYPIYFPLDPADCMCSSMQRVAEDINLRTGFACNTTNSECTNLQCDVYDGNDPVHTLSMFVDSCASPPALEFTLDINRERQTIRADDNTTVRLNSVQADLVIQLWHYDYSMDVELTVASGDTINIILTRHKIILDLTICGRNNPLNISDESTVPPTSITEPTVNPTPAYDTCGALQSITVLDGSLCDTNDACDALECEISSQRFEMAVISCHDPPGVRVAMYDSADHLIFEHSFYNGSNLVKNSRLPFTLNVTVQQIPPSAISVEIYGEGPLGYRIPIVPKTVIPIDKSHCDTVPPTTTAPTGTCPAMQYIQDTVSNVIASCYFPLGNNCSVLTCPVGDGLDLTLSILRCADPPAIRIAYGNGFVSVFDHTFDHSEVVPVEYFPNNTALNVTLDHLCPSDIGLKVDLSSDTDNLNIIPYTVIPINTTGCGVQSAMSCPSVTPTRPWTLPSSHVKPKPTEKPPRPTEKPPKPTEKPPKPTEKPPKPTEEQPTHVYTSPPPPPGSKTTMRPHPTSQSAPPTHGPQPTGGTEPPTDTTPPTPSFSSDTCKKMKEITGELNTNLQSFFKCVQKSCGDIECNATTEDIGFHLTLLCSPIAVEIAVFNYSLPKQLQKNSKIFTESGAFPLDDDSKLLVTIDDKEDDQFGFALEARMNVGSSERVVPLVNHTVIPVGACPTASVTVKPTNQPTDDSKDQGLSSGALGAAIAVPLIVLLSIVAVIVIVFAVYTIKRRRYRHYQLHRMTMSQLDDDEEC